MRALAVGAATLFIALTLAACGGDNAPPASPQPTAPARTTQPPSATAGNPTDPATFAKRKLPLDLAKGAALGKADAKVTLEAYEDFQCPFCLGFTMTLEPVVIDEYVAAGKVRLVFHNFPILGADSVRAALAATCAAAQEKFWPLQQRLFLEQAKAGQLTAEKTNIGRFSEENLRKFATESGAAGGPYDACLKDEATLSKVQDEVRSAQQLGLRGTPSLVLNGKPVATPPDAAAMRKLLDDAVAAAK